MRVIGVIPARYASSRFPGKPLADIAGTSLIERVYRQAVQSTCAKILVATDDQRIFDAVAAFGGNPVMTGEHTSGTDRIAEAATGEDANIIINIQGDEPLIDPAVINRMAAALAHNPWAAVSTAVTEISDPTDIDNPNIVKAVFDVTGRALYFSRSRIPFNRNMGARYYKHIGIYGYRRTILHRFTGYAPSMLEQSESLEQLRLLENGHAIHVSVVEYDSIGVDVPEDIDRVIRELRFQGPGGQ